MQLREFYTVLCTDDVAGTAAFYALLWPIAYSGGKQTYLGRLFIGTSTMAAGGWVPRPR